ncbi:calcipressin-3-like isoform X1 [Haliotis cracherodii]|uniref:calcipressin-3-like isoform X1 n=1 Tax=Haliotis cracherodii TaxID=6455 RepID=UPI0039E74778
MPRLVATHEEIKMADDVSDLPDALIATNVEERVFDDPLEKEQFENLFCEFDPSVTFQYLKSFRRVRINFISPELAAKARIHLHQAEFLGTIIKCYFAQAKQTTCDDSPHLKPPPMEKQFLISPPASPPVGWEQVQESHPVINYDLLAAIAQLAPGESHELHPPSESQPGIVVHICEDPEGYNDPNRPRIVQTRRPEAT